MPSALPRALIPGPARPIECSSAFDIAVARAHPAAARYCGPPSATNNCSLILHHQSRPCCVQAALRCTERRTTEVHAPAPRVRATRIPSGHTANLACIPGSTAHRQVVTAAGIHLHHALIVSVVGGCRRIPTNRLAVDAFSPHKYERASSKHLGGGAPPTNHTPSLRKPTPAAEPFAEMAKSGGDCAASSIAAAIEFVA